MYKGYSILCIIPARGGSKGLPNKNILPINGKPLLKHTIDQVSCSKHIDNVFVSTDCIKINQLCYGWNFPFIDRPDEFAMDDSPSSDTIIHAINHLKDQGMDFNVILMLECTSPLRTPDDIDNAIEMFIDNYGTTDSLIGVGELTSDTEHPYCIKIEEDGYLQPFIKDAPPIYQRQQLNKAYSVFGGIYMSKVYKYLQCKTFYQERTIGYKVERWQKFEIDDVIDFICVESIMKRK